MGKNCIKMVMFPSSDQLMQLFHCRARRRFSRGLKRKPMALIKRLRKAKKEAPPMEKPEVTHTNKCCNILITIFVTFWDQIWLLLPIYNLILLLNLKIRIVFITDIYFTFSVYQDTFT